MREASNPEDVVRSRLWSVLARPESADHRALGGPAAEPDRAVPAPGVSSPVPIAPGVRAPAGPVPPGWPTGEEGPLAWRDLIPSWPDDVDLDEDGTPVAAPGFAWQYEDGAQPLPVRQAAPRGDDSEAAELVRRVRLGAFDPGRRGVKALAAVAVLVVVVAAFLAWRARPRVDPVPPVPSSAVTLAGNEAGAGGSTGGAGSAGGGGAAARASAGGEVVIAVAGKVKKPGLVRLPAGSRVADALQAAGGAEPGVDVSLLNLARKVVDGELIVVGTSVPPAAVATGGAAGAAGAASGPINLNTATPAELDTLPGVGPVLAQRIIDAREAQGGFTAVTDLRKVDGIGDARYEQLKDLVTV